jgi:ParB family chromosome partitioning protein
MADVSDISSEATIQQIPLDQIRPSAHQVRKDFDEEGIKSLSESIAKEGLIQPITVRRVPRAEGIGPSTNSDLGPQASALYELIAGERRLRAIKSLGRNTIQARVVDVPSEASASAKGLVENLQRQDLNPIEEAEGFAALNQMDPKYWTQEQIGQVAGRDKGYISRSIGLLGLPEPIKEKLRARNFSRSHAVEFLRLPSQDQQLKAMETVQNQKLSWEATRKLVDDMLGKGKSPAGGKSAKAIKSEQDPLASAWPQVQTNRAVEAMGGWVVTYKKEHWNFAVSSTAIPTKEALAAWFIQMASALTVVSMNEDSATKK